MRTVCHILILVVTLLCSTISMAAAGSSPSLDVMIGQMLLAGFRGYEVDADSPIVKDITERHLGGVVLFDFDVALNKPERNIQSPEQLRDLNTTLASYAKIPLFISVDQEGGRVQRLKEKHNFHETPSAQNICAAGEFKVRTAAFMIGSNLSGSGFNLDFAPVTDVNVNPESPAIGKIERSFSADPEKVARCAELFVGELTRSEVLSCLKHFPGHGSAGGDSHLGVTDVTNTWTDAELIPYRRMLDKGYDGMIMTAHIFNAKLDQDYPATLSKKVITGILRQELGFDGVVITDDMNMKAITEQYGRADAIRLAIQAGADILLYGNNLVYDPQAVTFAHSTVKQLVADGTISKERIRQSYDRIMRLKKKL